MMKFIKKVKRILGVGRTMGVGDLGNEWERLLRDGDANGVPDILENDFSRSMSVFSDTDGDGVPDVLRTLGKSASHFSSSQVELRTIDGITTYCVNGSHYRSLDEMPPEHRALVENIQDGWLDARCDVSSGDRSESLTSGKPPIVCSPPLGQPGVSDSKARDPYARRSGEPPFVFGPLAVILLIFAIFAITLGGIIYFLIGKAW